MIDCKDVEKMNWTCVQFKIDRLGVRRYYKFQLTVTFFTGEFTCYTFRSSHPLSRYLKRIKDKMPDYGYGDIPNEYWSQVLKHLS